jgi:hypothetical protein
VGIVFVHGVGSQKPGQTLLQYAEPFIDTIGAWTRRQTILAPAGGTEDRRRRMTDPVRRSSIDFNGSTLPLVQIDIGSPEGRDQEHPPQTWLMTEAWWASDVEPPSLRTVANWLGPSGGVSQLARGLLESSIIPGGTRIAPWAELGLQFYISSVAAVALLGFTGLRAVVNALPIAAFKDALDRLAIDSFLTTWYGDVYVLLHEQAQAANVRRRTAEAVQALEELGCGSMVLVGHSGGTIVNYMTLTDPAYTNPTGVNIAVDKLITLGEAVNMAWRLEANEKAGSRMFANLTAEQPRLRWHDFWASHDPAPLGPVSIRLSPGIDPSHVASHDIWNRRSILDDHGGYWENDEEFIIPLLRELDTPKGDGSTSRFFRDEQQPMSTKQKALADAERTAAAQRQATAAGVLADRRAAPRRPAGRSSGRAPASSVRNDGKANIAEKAAIPAAGAPSYDPSQSLQPPFRTDGDMLRSRWRRQRVAMLTLWARASHVSILYVLIIAGLITGGGWLLDLGDITANAWGQLPISGLTAGPIDFIRGVAPWGTLPWLVVPAIGLLTLRLAIGAATLAALAPTTDWGPWDGTRIGVLWRAMDRLALVPILVAAAAGGIWVFAIEATGGAPETVVERIRSGSVDVAHIATAAAAGVIAMGLDALVLPIAIGILVVWPFGDRDDSGGGETLIRSRGTAALLIVPTILALICAVIVLAAVPLVGRWVAGSLIAFIGLTVISRIGNWRWDIWDARERSYVRRGVVAPPDRRFAFAIGIVLSLALGATTILLAAPANLPGGRGLWLAMTVASIATVSIVGIAHDISDAAADADSTTAGVPVAAGSSAVVAPPDVTAGTPQPKS